VKYDADGNFQWAASATGPGYDLVEAFTADEIGNSYITGTGSSPKTFYSATSTGR